MFRKKGYPKPILQKANKKKDTQMERIPFVTTFDVHLKRGYVEETNTMIRLRLNEHHSSIRIANSKMTSVSQHWAECKHNVSQLRWQVLEEVKANYTNTRH
ncbi:hypothetical protein XELAEV_18024856mg [Xenopus laevis]|uniref:Transposase n=1 Tax=Xenopus laevis TaxID=8355 RepID=A0A974CZK5_XENLA|nr:hypothetical protein XELAEV_18024856mg [Xenopus laevis]